MFIDEALGKSLDIAQTIAVSTSVKESFDKQAGTSEL
jgi:hypothetical protein